MQANPIIDETEVSEDNIFVLKSIKQKHSDQIFLLTSVANTRRHLMNSLDEKEIGENKLSTYKNSKG